MSMSIEEMKMLPDKEQEALFSKLSSIRHAAKQVNYSCQYGAGAEAISRNANITMDKAGVLHNAYHKLNWAVKAIVDDVVIRKVRGNNWIYNPVSELWYYLKTQKDVGSTLIQGTASYVFDLWVDYILLHRPQITAQFHDEVLLEVRKGYRDPLSKIVMDGIAHVNSELKLNVAMDADIAFGANYHMVH